MTSDESFRPRLRLGLLAALAVAALSAYPQIDLWRGCRSCALTPYVTIEFDEVCYSAYVNALAEGRPRRDDPFTGLDDSAAQPLPETYFSAQFVPPYLLALPARLPGLGASGVFVLLAPLSAAASALALYWLLGLVTRDNLIACAGTVFVLCMGSLAGTPRAVRALLGLRDPFPLLPFLPFLRRYVPAVPFPVFLIFCALVFAALTSANSRAALRRSIFAGLAFAVLVFSYFYLWTAALAWLACVAALWLAFRTEERRRAALVLGVVAASAVASLAPYALLLSRRGGGENDMLALGATRAPDPFRLTEMLGALVLIALALAARTGIASRRDSAWLFSASLALAPFACFNQQIVTGLSLQPVHYEKLVANYCVLAASAVAASLLWRGLKGASAAAPPRAILFAVALAALCWAGAETVVQCRLNRRYTLMRAQTRTLAARLRELARGAPPDALARQTVLFSPSLLHIHADTLPTDAPQPVLWAQHMFVFSGVTWRQYKERLYQSLYFAGVDERKLDAMLDGDDPFLRFVFLSYQPPPVTEATLRQEVRAYSDYAATFDRDRAAGARLAYLVTKDGDDADFSTLERFYERDAGERVGELVLYRLRLRE